MIRVKTSKPNKVKKKNIVIKKTRSIILADKVPDIVECHYEDDYDINNLHEIILLKIDKEKRTLDCLKQNINNKILELEEPHYINDYREILKEINIIQDKIIAIETGSLYREYQDQTLNLLNKYNLNDKNKLAIIEKYINIAKDYIDINVIRYYNQKNLCIGCGNDILKYYFINDIGIDTCTICGQQINICFNLKPTVNNHQVSETENLDNYLKALDRKQGLKPVNIPEKLYEDIDKYVQEVDKNDKRSREKIKALPYNAFGRKDGTDHKLLYTALEKMGYSEYYEDAEIIGHNLWGWKLKDFSMYKNVLIERYKIMQPAFNNMPNKDRVSNISTEYRMFKDLEGIGFPCYHFEFKLPEDISSIETIYRYMCENCGDPNIKFIPTIL